MPRQPISLSPAGIEPLTHVPLVPDAVRRQHHTHWPADNRFQAAICHLVPASLVSGSDQATCHSPLETRSMLGNIMDHRTDSTCPECDAVFEPSAHDNATRPDGTPYFDYNEVERDPKGFHVDHAYDTTVRDAVLHAEQTWSFPVTVYLYDKGARPVG